VDATTPIISRLSKVHVPCYPRREASGSTARECPGLCFVPIPNFSCPPIHSHHSPILFLNSHQPPISPHPFFLPSHSPDHSSCVTAQSAGGACNLPTTGACQSAIPSSNLDCAACGYLLAFASNGFTSFIFSPFSMSPESGNACISTPFSTTLIATAGSPDFAHNPPNDFHSIFNCPTAC